MAERAQAGILDRRSATGASRWWQVALRLAVIIIGGYAAASALVAGMARALPVTGLARSEAVVLASAGGFIVYLALLLWGFSRRRLTHLVSGMALAGGFGLALLMVIGN